VLWRSCGAKLRGVEQLVRRRGYRPKPLRRVYVPKKNGKLRPLSIPAMLDRAMQALHLLALNPIAEQTADRSSYGFRLRRSVADAWAQCHNVLAKRHAPEWVLEADIEACFDRLSHDWLLANIPMDRKLLRQWLEAGYLEDAAWHETRQGAPQGGVISPVIANLALDGLEEVARSAAPRVKRETRPKVNVVRYADDFLITGASRELLVDRVLPAVRAFLAERGLRLSEEKSKITRVQDGFEFLGAHLRKHGGKLLIKPSPSNVRRFEGSLRDFVREHPGMKTESLIRALNRKIRGWTEFYRGLVSSAAFRRVDATLYESLWRWIRRRHPRKRSRWLVRKYFCTRHGHSWVFWTKTRQLTRQQSLFPELEGQVFTLMKARSVTIRRHVKIRADANPFDPQYDEYFRSRRQARPDVSRGAAA
jgi:RNA-directed DNA polymerase